MNFRLRHQTGLEEKLGRNVLVKLSDLVSWGYIESSHVKRMSYDYNMNVITSYSHRRKGERIEVAMERMLDQWNIVLLRCYKL